MVVAAAIDKSLSPPKSSPNSASVAVQCRASSAASVVDRTARTARFSVLDNSWILRFDWDSWEMYDLQFDISEDAIDRTRIDAGTAMFTDEHHDDRRIGKITDCSIEDGKVYFDVAIGTSEWGQRYMQECADGVEPGKSIEVFITEMETVEPAVYEGEGWDRRLVQRAKKKATKYQFSGVSTVSTPAVGTVGFSAIEISHLEAIGFQWQQKFSTLQSQLEQLQLMSQTQQQTQEPVTTPTPSIASLTPTEESLSATPQQNNGEDVAALRSQLESLQAELAQQRADRRKEGIESFLAQNQGRITPAMREFSASSFNMLSFMQSLNDGQLQFLQAWMKQCLHQAIPTAPVMAPGEFRSTAKTALKPEELAAKAKDLWQKLNAQGTPIDFSTALDRVMAEHGVVNR